ncbi:MAG: hypothetical protein AAGG38_13095 [Planctomycetota bacterium]
MLPKLFSVIAVIVLIAAALLGMEQHRLRTLHAMADLHVQMDRDRKTTWEAQTHIAEGTHPAALQEAVQRVGLELAPLPATAPVSPGGWPWPDPDHFTHAPQRKPLP